MVVIVITILIISLKETFILHSDENIKVIHLFVLNMDLTDQWIAFLSVLHGLTWTTIQLLICPYQRSSVLALRDRW